MIDFYHIIALSRMSILHNKKALLYLVEPKVYVKKTLLILFENQIQTTSASPYRTQVQLVASFLVCSLIFIEYKMPEERA